MQTYRYRAAQKNGQVIVGMLTAPDEHALSHALANENLELISARAAQDKPFRLQSARPSARVVAAFCTHMAELMRVGVPFAEALQDVAEGMERSALRDALRDVRRTILSGRGIAESFARQSAVFPPIFIALLSAGVATGDLTATFARLAHYMESRASLNERLHRALRYPLFLCLVAGGVFAFMMLAVVPQIILFLNTIGGELPPMTRILIALAEFVATGWPYVLGAAFGLLSVGWILRRMSETAARILDGWVLRLPMLGATLGKIIRARFAYSFALLVESGTTIPESLAGARVTLGNQALAHSVDGLIRRVESGAPLSVAFANLFPPAALRLVRRGEQSGQLAQSLRDIAALYDREAAEATDKMLGVLEPALTLMVGALLAWIVLAVLGPIYGSLATMNVVG